MQITSYLFALSVCRKRIDDMITGLDKKQDAHREAINKLQQQFQLMQMKKA